MLTTATSFFHEDRQTPHFPQLSDLLPLLVHFVFHQHPDVFLVRRRARLCVFWQKIRLAEEEVKSSPPLVLLVSALIRRDLGDAIRGD